MWLREILKKFYPSEEFTRFIKDRIRKMQINNKKYSQLIIKGRLKDSAAVKLGIRLNTIIFLLIIYDLQSHQIYFSKLTRNA